MGDRESASVWGLSVGKPDGMGKSPEIAPRTASNSAVAPSKTPWVRGAARCFHQPYTPLRMPGATPSNAPSPGPGDVQPVAHETRDRLITGTVTVVPFAALALGIWLAWNSVLFWSDVIVFLILYTLTALGITVGFHRLFTHRSFATTRPLRAIFAILGSAAIEGPVISWVSDHRKHHAFSDQPGDPHSPHVDHGQGWAGSLRGLLHAHVGWLFIHTQRGAKARYAPDLIADPIVSRIDRTFVVWAVGGLLAAFWLGLAIGGTWTAALTGFLWGGVVRMMVLHHVTYSINSLCHFFGRKRFESVSGSPLSHAQGCFGVHFKPSSLTQT